MQVQRKYALKLNFMKIEIENSIKRLRFFLPTTGHQNCLDKSLRLEKAVYLPLFVVANNQNRIFS